MSTRARARLLAMLAATAVAWSAAHAPADSPRRDPARPRRAPSSPSSARVLAHDEPLYFEPDTQAPRRGSAMLGALLPVYASRRSAGCRESWLLVGPQAWLCGDRVDLGASPPMPRRRQPERHPTGLPFAYYFVGADGSFGYDTLSQADVTVPVAELQPGFAVGVLDLAQREGESYAFTTKRLWLPARDLRPARPSTFGGVEVHAGDASVGWTHLEKTHVHDAPGGRRLPEIFERKTQVRIQERIERLGRTWMRIGEARWVRAEDLRLVTFEGVPESVEATERWIDVDLAHQTLTAYVGTKPVYATLVSSGKGRGADPQATPTGAHRVWVKLRTSDMTNLEDLEASGYYAMEEVPWVMFFDKGVGLHGAYWHDSFGNVRSHGCVNLAPRDAEWLFHWAGPHLPEGWRAAFPTEYDPGTLVRVR